MRPPRSFVVLAAACLLAWDVNAQEMKLPAWMLQAFARERTAAEDSLADARLYAAFGVEQLQPNAFIGSFRMTVDVTGTDAPMRIEVEHWSDTMKAVVRFIMPESSGMLSYLVDLKANTAILATERKGRKEAVIHDLRSAALFNSMAVRNADKLVPEKGQRKERIAGHACTEHTAQWDNETVHLWLSTINGSPFVDARHWLPFGQSLFAIYTAPSLHGEPMPLRWTSRSMRYEVNAVQLGPTPAPVIDLATYQVKDERRRQGTGTARSTAGPKPTAKVPEPAYYQALRGRTRNAFVGSMRWQWVYRKPDEALFRTPESHQALVATPDTLLMMLEYSILPVSSATLCLRGTHALTEFGRTGPPRTRTYTPYVVDKVPFDAPVPQPTGRTKRFEVALPFPAGTAIKDDGRPSAKATFTAHEYMGSTAAGDTVIAWIVPEIPSPFHDIYAAGHAFYGAGAWHMGVLPVDGLPLRIHRTNGKGASELSVTELGVGPVDHLLKAFARDTLDADMRHAIPDRPAVYEEAVRHKENRFTGHVHLVYGKFHPDSLEARTAVHLDWYATPDRMLLVENSTWMHRAWIIDRRTHTVEEHALKDDEVIQRPPYMGRTYPPNHRRDDTLMALGRDTTMLGMPCALYQDPRSGARLVVATGIPSPWQDLYGFDPRYIGLASIDMPWLQPVEGTVLQLTYPTSTWKCQVVDVDRSPVDERVFSITKDTWRP